MFTLYRFFYGLPNCFYMFVLKPDDFTDFAAFVKNFITCFLKMWSINKDYYY